MPNSVPHNNKKYFINSLENKTIKSNHHLFFNGSCYDADSLLIDLINSAEESIILIDKCIDDSTLTMLVNNDKVDITLISSTFTKELDIKMYQQQCKSLKQISNDSYHDRYLMIDSDKVYYMGASIKDAGSKTFNVYQMRDFDKDFILNKGGLLAKI